jgi:hypothetical protein
MFYGMAKIFQMANKLCKVYPEQNDKAYAIKIFWKGT